MKTSLMVAAAIAALLPLYANAADKSDDLDCKNAVAQPDLNACANRAYEAEDKKLNALYKQVMSKSNAKDQESLRAAERGWIAYRDNECQFETSDSEGGSIRPMEEENCLADKTRARIKELQSQGG